MPIPVILIVDDEALLRMLAVEHFADAGFEVLEASNGAEALAVVNDRRDIKAVVTDVQMPGEPDGFLLSHAVREALPRSAIVVVSGRVPPSRGDLAERARYVSKPYRGEDIVHLIEAMLTDMEKVSDLPVTREDS